MNKVMLIGRITKDIELVQVGENYKTRFSLAVDKGKNQNGESQADFIEVEAWKGTAEILNKYTKKGSKIAICGRITTSNYTKDDGNKVYKTFVVAENVELLDSKRESENPQEDNQYNNTSNVQTGQQFTPDDEDLPF